MTRIYSHMRSEPEHIRKKKEKLAALKAKGPPEFFILDRFREPVERGLKKQVLIMGKWSYVPEKGGEFILVRKDRQKNERVPFARGICVDCDDVYVYFDDVHPSVELGYQYWDGESECRECLTGFEKCDPIARAEGFQDWRALQTFYLNRPNEKEPIERFQGYIVKWDRLDFTM